MYYRVVLTKNNKVLPNLFIDRKWANRFIALNKLDAYIITA